MNAKRNLAIIKDILFRYKYMYLSIAIKRAIKYKFIFMILSIFIEISIASNYIWHYSSSSTEKIPLFISLFAFNTVIVTGIGIIYQVDANSTREIKFKVHRQRKIRYEKLLENIKDELSIVLIGKAIENTQILNRTQNITEEQKHNLEKLLNFQFELMLYGSPQLIDKYIKQRQIQIQTDPIAGLIKTINSIEEQKKDASTLIREKNSMYNLIKLFETISQMRKEIGFEGNPISVRKLMSIQFDAINDPQFDQFFIDMNVPII